MSEFDDAVRMANVILDQQPSRDPDDDLSVLARQFRRAVEANTAAFEAGFEHAVAGGQDAATKMPQLKGCLPLVMFFKNAADRQEMIAAVHTEKPDMIAVRIPERR